MALVHRVVIKKQIRYGVHVALSKGGKFHGYLLNTAC